MLSLNRHFGFCYVQFLNMLGMFTIISTKSQFPLNFLFFDLPTHRKYKYLYEHLFVAC